MDFDAAAEALASAVGGNEAPAEPVAAPAPAEQAPANAPEVGGNNPAQSVDSFTNIDPNSLPPELQAQYRNMQSHFTREMQRVRELERTYEAIGDPEQALQAMQLAQALQEDPVGVHQQLTQYLEAQGLSPAQAAAVADEAMGDPYADADPFDDPGDGLSRKVQELESKLEQWEAQERERAYMGQLQREENAIRQAHPEYSDDDVNAIYELAFAHGGSLMRAEKAFSALRDRWASSYMEQKASVPAGVGSPGTTGHAQQPAKFDRVDDPALEAAALAALKASLEG